MNVPEPFFNNKGKFIDRIILNRDVREYVSENKEIILLYSFINNETIVITNSENGLREIIQSIKSGRQRLIKFNWVRKRKE